MARSRAQLRAIFAKLKGGSKFRNKHAGKRAGKGLYKNVHTKLQAIRRHGKNNKVTELFDKLGFFP